MAWPNNGNGNGGGNGTFDTLTVTGETILGGAAGSESLHVPHVSGANQWVEIMGAGNLASPSVRAAGVPSTVTLGLHGKGTGNVMAFVQGQIACRFSNPASASTFLEIGGAASGVLGPALSAQSSAGDPDIDIRLNPKGAGVLRFGTFTANADAPVNGYITIKDAAGNTHKLATIA